MTDKMIAACVVMAAVTVVAAPFIRRAALYRKRLRRREPAPQSPPLPAGTVRKEGYRARYILAPRNPFTSGKTVRIRPEYYGLLRKITAAAPRGGMPVTAYVDNVLRAHFEDHREEIEQLYGKGGIFNGQG